MKEIPETDLQNTENPADGWFIIEAAGDHPALMPLPDGAQRPITQHLTTDILSAIVEAGVPAEGLPIDKDHLSLDPENSTEALGWVRNLAICHGDLAAFIEWSALGLPLIQGRVYKHFSTVYPSIPDLVDPKGFYAPQKLVGLALTNQPNNKQGQPPITNRAAGTTQTNTDTNMNPEILAQLGLAEGATDEEVLAAIRSLKDAAQAAAEQDADSLISNEEKDADTELTNEEKQDCREQILTNRDHGLRFTRLLCRDKARSAAPAAPRRYADRTSPAQRAGVLANSNRRTPEEDRAARINSRAKEICDAERAAGRTPNWHVAHARASREIC